MRLWTVVGAFGFDAWMVICSQTGAPLLVSRLPFARAQSGCRTTGEPVIVPVQVAGERELDRMMAGGKSSARQFLQDNASIIRSIAKGGR